MEISEYKKLKNQIISDAVWDYLLENYDYCYIDNTYKLLPKKQIKKEFKEELKCLEKLSITKDFN